MGLTTIYGIGLWWRIRKLDKANLSLGEAFEHIKMPHCAYNTHPYIKKCLYRRFSCFKYHTSESLLRWETIYVPFWLTTYYFSSVRSEAARLSMAFASSASNQSCLSFLTKSLLLSRSKTMRSKELIRRIWHRTLFHARDLAWHILL